MQNAARFVNGTTLYLAEYSNGLVCNLKIRESSDNSGKERHVWSTSLPLLDHLYPHWLGKQPSSIKIDFLEKSLKKAEEAFGWKMMLTSKRFRIPEDRFGEGLSRVVVYKDSQGQSLVDDYKKDSAITFIERSNYSLGKEMLKKVDDFDVPVIVLVMNFLSIELIECIPKFVGSYKRWEYKVSKIVFDSPQEFIDNVASKRFMPFVGYHMEENHIFNTILNYTYWKPQKTSSSFVADLYRALVTSLLNELTPHSSIAKLKEGVLIATGELPMFINDSAKLELSIVDGLGLSGYWNITIDSNGYTLPYILSEGNDIKSEIIGENSKLWIIPQLRKKDTIVELVSKDAQIKAVNGNIYSYFVHGKIHDSVVEINGSKSKLNNTITQSVETITFDLRPWPVVYGPNAMVNSERIPAWIDRINNRLKVN